MEYAGVGTGDASRRVAAVDRGGEASAVLDVGPLPAGAAPLDVTAAGPGTEAPAGMPYLRALLGGTEWLVPLAGLRAVLAELPRVVPLPQAPEWLLGVFPYRAELLALVDPAPMLAGSAAVHPAGQTPGPAGGGLGELGRCALIAGAGERTLAWRLERVGDVVHLPESAVASEPRGAMSAPAVGGRRFCAGMAALGESPDARLPVLDVDGLLAALLDGLAEEERGE